MYGYKYLIEFISPEYAIACGSGSNAIISDLKTLRGVINRARRWIKAGTPSINGVKASGFIVRNYYHNDILHAEQYGKQYFPKLNDESYTHRLPR